jgi:hypothetical protein
MNLLAAGLAQRLFHYFLKLAANGLQRIFEKWVERCKKYIACRGRYFENEAVTPPPKISDSE